MSGVQLWRPKSRRQTYDFGLRVGPELSPIGRVDAIAGSTTNVSVIGPNPMIAPWWISVCVLMCRPSRNVPFRLSRSSRTARPEWIEIRA